MPGTTSRPTELARNARFTLSFVVRTLGEDPLWLAVQAARRTPPRLRGPLVRVLQVTPRPSAPHALGLLLGGDAAGAAAEAAGLLDGSGGRRSRRLAAEVAVAVGRPDLLDGRTDVGPARFRAAWALGDVEVLERAGADDVPRALRAQVTALRPTTVAEPRPAAETAEPVSALDPAETTATRMPEASTPSSGIRVLHHLTNSLPHTQSGYTLRSHSILTAQRAAGLHVTATTRAGYPLTIGSLGARGVDVVDGVQYRRLLPRTAGGGFAEAVDLLVAAAEESGAQVLHATTPYATGDVVRHAAERLGLPWVYEVRGLPEETWVASHATPEARERAERSRRRELMRAKETELALTADAVVTLSETMRGELVDRGVPAAKITVLPNAVPDALLTADHPSPQVARRRLDLPERFTLGTVSSIVDYEGLETVVRVVALLRAQGRDVTGLVVGDGVARPGLVRLARELGVADDVVFPGRVGPAEALTRLAALDVVLVPRRPDRVTRLVTPLKPVEAMAVGRPVVASDLPALTEAVGGAGLLVDPLDVDAWAEAVWSLAESPALYGELVAKGRAVAQTRTWARSAAVYRSMYLRSVGCRR